jgi:hypothetical protein
LNKTWSAALSIDVTDDPGRIRSMAIAGSTGVFIGFEPVWLVNDPLSEPAPRTVLVAPDFGGRRIIARTSSMAYKHTRKNSARIGRELGVEYVLENSVRCDGTRTRTTTQLIRARDQTHVWDRQFSTGGMLAT